MQGLAGPAQERCSQTGGKCFSLSGGHFSELSVEQCQCCHELHRIREEPQTVPGRGTHQSECVGLLSFRECTFFSDRDAYLLNLFLQQVGFQLGIAFTDGMDPPCLAV